MDAYLVLGVSPDSTMEEIREKYIKLVKRYHPDNDSAIENEEILKQINIAYCSIKQEREKAETEKEYGKRVYTASYEYTSDSRNSDNNRRAESAGFNYRSQHGKIEENVFRGSIREEHRDYRKKYTYSNYSNDRRKHKSNHVIFALSLIAVFFILRLLLLIFT